MKKILLLGIILSFNFLLIGCGKNAENDIPKKELPEESPVCPEGFYRFDSVKTCVMTKNAEIPN